MVFARRSGPGPHPVPPIGLAGAVERQSPQPLQSTGLVAAHRPQPLTRGAGAGLRNAPYASITVLIANCGGDSRCFFTAHCSA